jgi:Beta-galactosidase
MRRGISILLASIMVAAAPAASKIAGKPWRQFQIIMWQQKTQQQYEALRALGVTAAKVQADRNGETLASAARNAAPIISAGLRIFVENIATDFYSAYHRWTPDKPVNWKFLALKQSLKEDPRDRDVFLRDPSLSDPVWLASIQRRLAQTVRSYAAYRPLYFNLADEGGIADLSAAWDFDYSAPSLSGMRDWLRLQYGSLAALNREWGTSFDNWSDVVPLTTTQAMARTDGNYASWSDFKEWMDVAYARAVAAGSQAVHQAEPWARSAIEGAQEPGWGGYDYSRLATAVDVMEIYDAADNVEIARSFHPDLTLLTTMFDWSRPDSLHRAWRELLRGTSGMVLWDDQNRYVTPDGQPGSFEPTAKEFFAGARSGLGRTLLDSHVRWDAIAVLYSPASFRIQWILDHRNLGSDWVQRTAEDEDQDNAERAARHRTLRLLGLLGFTPRFVSEQQIVNGTLRGYKMLALPQALALSPAAANAIRRFVENGGAVVADGDTGQFDSHGRRLDYALLSGMFDTANPRVVRLSQDKARATDQLNSVLRASGLKPVAKVEDASGGTVPDVTQYVRSDGSATIVSLLADPAADGSVRHVPVELVLRDDAYIYDVRSGALLGRESRLPLDVISHSPTVVALTTKPLMPDGLKSLFHLGRVRH